MSGDRAGGDSSVPFLHGRGRLAFFVSVLDLDDVSKLPIAIIGCGYVGSALAKALVDAGHDVVATTTTPERVDALCALGTRGELLDVADVDRLTVVLADREVVYLLIAPKVRGEEYRDVYLSAARNLAEAVAGSRVQRIIYTSSTRVYGQDDGSWVDESSPTEPRDERGRVLLAAENVLLEARTDDGTSLAVTVVRLAGICGPGRDPAERIKALSGTERDDGEVYVNLIHRDDIVIALGKLSAVPHHGVVNLSDGRPELRCALYDRIIAGAGLSSIRWIDPPSPKRLGKRIRNDRIKELLNIELKGTIR